MKYIKIKYIILLLNYSHINKINSTKTKENNLNKHISSSLTDIRRETPHSNSLLLIHDKKSQHSNSKDLVSVVDKIEKKNSFSKKGFQNNWNKILVIVQEYIHKENYTFVEDFKHFK